jgi:chorismate-pyruvate lyase
MPFPVRYRLALASAAPALLVPAAASAAPRPAWPDTPLARVEVLAILQSLESALLSHDSATLVLDDWCARHRLAPPGTAIVAERVRGEDKPITIEQRRDLHLGDADSVSYRRVRLRCGEHVLSEADNWYVPARLTPAMNAALESTDIAFGRAVQALHFQRRTLSARLLWSPLPPDWDSGGAALPRASGGAMAMPDRLIEHRAILVLPDGTPFSEVVETYMAETLAFPPPALAPWGRPRLRPRSPRSRSAR